MLVRLQQLQQQTSVFDVTNLFTSIPTTECLKLIKDSFIWMTEIKYINPVITSRVIDLLSVCIDWPELFQN